MEFGGGMSDVPDRADDAMVARAHERFAAERKKARKLKKGSGAAPNVIVIGGLKCGTTSLHHYLNAHPSVEMSRPKELNFFVEELNWELGRDWYFNHFNPEAKVRGETSPHYTNLPRFKGVPERIRRTLGDNVKLIYVVRNPIERVLSHYVHNIGGGYDDRPIEEALGYTNSAYVNRSRYFMQLSAYLEFFDRSQIAVVTQDDLRDERVDTMNHLFRFLGLEKFNSEEFERQWETGSAKVKGGFRLLDRAVRLPGLRVIDRNFDRLPERLRWGIEKIVHRPGAGPAAKPELPAPVEARLRDAFAPDVEALQEYLGRDLGWL